MKAITKKFRMLEIKSPYRNVDALPLIEFTENSRVARFPEEKNNPISGLTMSFVRAVIRDDAATHITKAIASPITPKVYRKINKLLQERLFFCWIYIRQMEFLRKKKRKQ